MSRAPLGRRIRKISEINALATSSRQEVHAGKGSKRRKPMCLMPLSDPICGIFGKAIQLIRARRFVGRPARGNTLASSQHPW